MLRRLGDTRLVGIGLAVFAAADSLFLVPRLPVVLVGGLLAGIGITWLIVAFGTAFQLRRPLAVQGRVWAAANLACAVQQTLSIAGGAALSTVVDYRVLIVVMSAVTALAGLWLVRRRELAAGTAPAHA